MRIGNIKSHTFKGYDAAPLKALHTCPDLKLVKSEMQEIANRENFKLKMYDLNEGFCQDYLTIIEKNGKPLALVERDEKLYAPHLNEMQKAYGIDVQLYPMFSKSIINGGNFFIGKMPNGEKWMLVGKMDKFSKTKEGISSTYEVKEENIHFISQQDYHLDMSIRPIGYPYVLVNSPKRASIIEAKLKNRKFNPEEIMGSAVQLQYKKAIEELEKAGFKPIPIGGVFEDGINFMNAIVNKHEDGTISYITNSSKSKNPFDAKYQRTFEKNLRNALNELAKTDPNAPKLRDIYFVEGEIYDWGNEMRENILEGWGGVHCMHSEEPDFKIWKA